MAFERVYSVWDYWDGIRSGFADFHGTPHYFEASRNEPSGDYSEVFELMPVSEETIELVVQHAEIFRSWARAFHRGDATVDSHPRQPGENDLYLGLEQEIRISIESSDVAHRMRGRFEANQNQNDLPKGMIRDVRVEWSEP